MRDPYGALTADELALLAAAPHPDPQSLRPALATLATDVPVGPGWLFEQKLDGIRCLVSRAGGVIDLRSRSGRSMTGGFPELADAFADMSADDIVVDGEIVAYDGPRISFARLQPRMLVARATPGFKGIAIYFYAFDLLYADGHDVRQLPLVRRKAVLGEVLEASETVRFAAHREGDGHAMLAEARREQWEGLVAKRAGSPYPRGRSRDWLKIKVEQSQELVVGGWTDPTGTRRHFGALLLGYYDGAGTFVYAGRVGSGFTEAALAAIAGALAELAVPESPFERGSPPRVGAHWVEPAIVAQVGFSDWTSDGLLRQPRFRGLRTDKMPRDVVREIPC